MRIRRYEAPTIQEALQKVKLELGPEAVILYTKKVKKGGFFGLLGSDDETQFTRRICHQIRICWRNKYGHQ